MSAIVKSVPYDRFPTECCMVARQSAQTMQNLICTILSLNICPASPGMTLKNFFDMKSLKVGRIKSLA